MLYQVSHKVDIIFWAGLKPDIRLEEEQMKTWRKVIKLFVIFDTGHNWGHSEGRNIRNIFKY